MFKALAQLFTGKGKERTKEIHDAVLGTLRWNEEDWWEADVRIDGRALGFKICGDCEPGAALMAHAREIFRSFKEFDRMVVEFLASQASQASQWPGASDEIRQLVIEDVCLFWPDRPNDGMIFFKGPDPYRLWRCDYVDRKPRGLGFDG